MTYERCTVAELVAATFGTFEDCVDVVLISTELTGETLIPHFNVGGLSEFGVDWLSLAFWQEYAEDE